MAEITPHVNIINVASYQKSTSVRTSLGDSFGEIPCASRLQNALKPLYVSMSIVGLFHCKRDAGNEKQRLRGNHSCALPSFSQVYSTIILILHWLNFIRTATMLREDMSFGPELFYRVIFVLWALLCTIQCTCMYIACAQNKNNICELHEKFEYILTPCEPCIYTWLRRRCIILVAISWFVVLLNVLFAIYGIWCASLFSPGLTPFKSTDANIDVVRVIYVIIHTYLTATWFLSLIFHHILCLIIYHIFKQFNKNFSEICQKSPVLATDIERYRRQHISICHLLDLTDDKLHVITGMAIAVKILLLCLILYNIIWHPASLAEPVVALIHIFWAISGVILLGIISVGGALVNHVVSTHIYVYIIRYVNNGGGGIINTGSHEIF